MHCITLLDVGGVEGQVLSTSNELLRRGHDVRILVLRPPRERSGFRTDATILFVGLSKSPLGIVRGLFVALRAVRAFRPDIVHGHSFHANMFTRLLRMLERFPYLVNTFHTSCGPRNTLDGGRWHTLAYRMTDFLVDVSTNVSKEATETFAEARAVPRKKLRTVYDAIDTERFQPSVDCSASLRETFGVREGSFVWLAVGRLAGPKDYRNLLEAFAAVLQEIPDSLLFVVGDGPDRETLNARVRELSIEKHVRFLGTRLDVPRLMQCANAYVLSSAWEGFPNALGEAMSSALPCVSTDCGGVLELLGNEGWIVPVSDSHALGRRMVEVASLDRETRVLRGNRARQRVLANYSLEKCVANWLELYGGSRGAKQL